MTTEFPLSKDREDALEGEVGPPGFWYQTQDFQIGFLRSQGLEPDHQFAEIGCGVIRGGLRIMRYLDAGRYTGIDVRASAIATAKELVEEFGLADKAPTLQAASDFGAEYLDDSSQDFIFAFAVIYHLEEDLVRQFFRTAQDKIRPKGKIIVNVHCVPPFVAGHWKGFPFIPRPLDDYQRWARDAGLDAEVLGTLKEFGYPDALAGKENHVLALRKSESPVAKAYYLSGLLPPS